MFFVSLSIPEGPIAHQLSIAKSRQWWCWCWWWRWRWRWGWRSLWWLSGSSRSSSQEVTSAQAATTLLCKVHSSQVLIDCMWIIYFIYSINCLGLNYWKVVLLHIWINTDEEESKLPQNIGVVNKERTLWLSKPFIISFTLYVETH